jgi:hypothetical protein
MLFSATESNSSSKSSTATSKMGLISAINTLIPFADASRPIWIDIIYSLVLCTALWLGPQLQEYFQKFSRQAQAEHTDENNQDERDARRANETMEERLRFRELMNDSELSNHSEDDDSDAPILDVDDAAFQAFLAHQPGPANPVPAPLFDEEQQEEELPPQQPVREQLIGPNGLPPGQQPRLRDPNRHVGAKKARSLARRQQVRAYHEFVREQSDMQRAQDASTKDQRDAAAQAERDRRKAVEEKIRREEAIQRETRREAERLKREEEARKVREMKSMLAEELEKGKLVSVRELARRVSMTEEWVIQTVKLEGLLGEKKSAVGTKVLVMLVGEASGEGPLLVRVDEQDVQEMYNEVTKQRGSEGNAGFVNGAELGTILSRIIMRRNGETA